MPTKLSRVAVSSCLGLINNTVVIYKWQKLQDPSKQVLRKRQATCRLLLIKNGVPLPQLCLSWSFYVDGASSRRTRAGTRRKAEHHHSFFCADREFQAVYFLCERGVLSA